MSVPGVGMPVRSPWRTGRFGRGAQDGVLLIDDNPPVRVVWQADRSKRYLEDAHRRDELLATVFGRA